MLYPRAIADQIEDVRAITALWPPDTDVSTDDVINWILQFDEPDFGLALRVIRNLNVVGQKDIDRGLKVAFSKLSRKAVEKGSRITGKNTLYATMGEVGKSGAMIGYHFRMNTAISEENFLTPETFQYIVQGKVENIVLIDDVIGTGKQATKEINELAADVLPLGIKNIFVLTVCGMREAIDEIMEETKAFTFSAFEYSLIDTAASLDSAFYNGVPHDDRQALKERLSAYGRISYDRNPLGFGDIGGLLVLPYNTPNTTLPILWSNNNEWIPLFRRVRRVNGIAAYQSQFKKAAERKNRTETKDIAADDSVTLFVEGKRDEVFFDELIKSIDLAKILGVSEVRTVSLGTNVASERLAKLLSGTTPNAVFIVDDERGPRPVHTKIANLVPIIKLKPSFFELLDIDRITELVLPRFRGVPNFPPDISRDELRMELERFLLRMPPMERSLSIIRLLVEMCLDNEKVSAFINDLRRSLRDGVVNNSTDETTSKQ